MALSLEKLRAWWSHRQGLDGQLAGKAAAEILERTGWVRGLGGVGTYLALHARAEISRESVDGAVAKLQIHELPAARGCTYIVPAGDFALALRAGEPFEGAEMKTALKLGVTEKEIAKLCGAVLKALEKTPLDPDGIREAVGSASRSLGEEGKKKGMTTTLPTALGKLQAAGEIRRVSTNGRLDQQRYRYTLWHPNPLAKFKMTPEEINIELARRFFSWTGPATLTEFQTFLGSSVKAAKAAMEALKIETVEADWLMLPADRDAFESFKIPKQAHYVLVSSIDGLSLFRREFKNLIAEADWNREAYGDKGLTKLSALGDLHSHGIFDRGRLVGLWEFDPEANSMVWASFIPKNQDLEKAVARTEEFVHTQLGDARGYSLDSVKSRAPRLAALRKADAG
jgi:winged helix DNA-binding protein